MTADKIASQAAAEGVPIVMLYPGVIYGPGKLTTGNIVAQLVRFFSVFLIHWILNFYLIVEIIVVAWG